MTKLREKKPHGWEDSGASACTQSPFPPDALPAPLPALPSLGSTEPVLAYPPNYVGDATWVKPTLG